MQLENSYLSRRQFLQAAAALGAVFLAACAGKPTTTPDAQSQQLHEIDRENLFGIVANGLQQILNDTVPEGAQDPLTTIDRSRINEVSAFMQGLQARQDPAELAGYSELAAITNDQVVISPLVQTVVGGNPVAASISLQGKFNTSTHSLTLPNNKRYYINDVYQLNLGILMNPKFAELDSRFVAFAFAKEYFTWKAFLGISEIADTYYAEQYGAILTKTNGGEPLVGAKIQLVLDAASLEYDSEIWTAVDSIPYVVLNNMMKKLTMTFSPDSTEGRIFNALQQIPQIIQTGVAAAQGALEALNMDQLVNTIFIEKRKALYEEIWPKIKALYYPDGDPQATPTNSGNLAQPSN